MSRLDRYLAWEILLPFGAGLLFLTQILLATQILAQADVLFGSGVSVISLLSVALNMTPHFLGYVIPVAFLLGAVVGVGRLADDREVVALSASGISPVHLVRVPIGLAVLVAVAALYVGLRMEPYGLRRARQQVNEIIKQNVTSDVKAGVFYEEIPDLTLYVEGAGEGGGFTHVLISDRSDPRAPLLALARQGRLEPAGAGEALRLVLAEGELHREESGGERGEEYVSARFGRADIVVGVGATLGERNRFVGSPFEMTPEEIVALSQARAAAGNAKDARRWRTFLHRRIAGPLAVVAFALLAVPVAASRRGGRAFGYVATLLAVVGYYALMRFGEGLAHGGRLPVWLGPHLGNLVAGVGGLLLTAWMARRGTGAVR
jgi:lipopolysaccharide export system permease protein